MKKDNLPIGYNNSTEMWEDFGFLEGLDDETKEICIKGYDKITDYLLDNDLELNTRVEVMVYPTVRKIIQENKNVEIVPELLINMLADIYEELSKLDKFIDVEAETCATTFGEYLNKKEG